MQKLTQRPGYRWVVVGSCFVMIMVCLGFCSSTKGLYLNPVVTALKVPRSLYALNDTLRYLSNALVNLFFGAAILRFGPRKLIGAGFVCLIGAMLAYALADGLAVIYLGGILLGAGQSWVSTALVGYVIGRLYPHNKGTIMGAVLAGNGIGSAVAVQIIDPFIKNGGAFGYRNGYWVTALILLAVGLLVVLLFRDPGEQPVLKPQKVQKKARDGWKGITLKQCWRTPWFYGVAFYVFVMGMVIQTISGMYVDHMELVGLDPDYIPTVVSVYSLLLTCTKFLTGFAYDRLGLGTTMLICNLATVAAPVLLLLLGPGSKVMAMVFGVVYATGVPIQTIGMPLITTDLFGYSDEPRILGLLVSVSTVGYAVGTPLISLFCDLQGSYRNGLWLMAIAMTVSVAVMMLSMASSRKQREKIFDLEES